MKQVVKRIAKWGCLVLLFVLGALSIFFVLFFYSLATPQYVCLDDGKVWDGKEQRCRDDCLTWNEVNGCIYMDEEYRRLFAACADKSPDCDQKRLDDLYLGLCQKYQAPVNLEYGYCDFAFEKKDCFKLEGAWAYPPICGEEDSGVNEAVPVSGAGG